MLSAAKPARRWVRALALSVAILLAAAAIVLGVCAFAYAHDLHIDRDTGVEEARYVRIGGIDQWIQIRGRDRHNPVLLWLNGGPGFSVIPDTYFYRDWEKSFTVVMWDQRGEGRTFDRSGAVGAGTMTIDQFTRDGIEVVEYLKRRLQVDQVVLLGHSWGSMLGVHMVQRRPDLFAAYVGTGQGVRPADDAAAAYPLLLARAHALGNLRAEQELSQAGPPPYGDSPAKWVWVRWANALDPPAPTRRPLTPGAFWALERQRFDRDGVVGADFSQQAMWEEMQRDDLPAIGRRFAMPVFFFQGAEDRLTVTALARQYFDALKAPRKAFVVFPNVGHLAIFRAPEIFLAALNQYVRPLVATSAAPQDVVPCVDCRKSD